MEKKLLFPVTYGIPEKHEGLVKYHVCSNGTFMTKKVAGRGYVTLKVDGIPGTGEGKETVSVLPRKIPVAYFWKIREFFQYVENHFNEGLEAYILLCYNYDTDMYFLYVPPHVVSVASVKYDISEFHKLYPNSYILLDCHSHGSKIGGYFSGTDDKDDNRERFSMVIGKIDKIIPEYKIRFSTMGKFFNFELEDIFTKEGKIECDTLVFPEAIKNIKLVNTEPTRVSSGDGIHGVFERGFAPSGYTPGYRGRSLYESIRYQVVDKKKSLADLVGEDWLDGEFYG